VIQVVRAIDVVTAIIIIAIVASVTAVIAWYLVNQSNNVTFSWSITDMKIKVTWSGYSDQQTTVSIYGLSNPDKNSIQETWDGNAVAVKGIAVLMYNTWQLPWRLGVYTGTNGKSLPWWAWSGDYYVVKINSDWSSSYRDVIEEGERIFEIKYNNINDVQTNLGVSLSDLLNAGFSVTIYGDGSVSLSTNKYFKHHITLHLAGVMEQWYKANPWSTSLVSTKSFDKTDTFEVITLW